MKPLTNNRPLKGGQPHVNGSDRFIGTKRVPTAADDEYDNRYHSGDVELEPEDNDAE